MIQTQKEKDNEVVNNFSRPVSEAQALFQKIKEKNDIKKSGIDLTELKNNLRADVVLQYAVQKYKINTDNFKIAPNNKINNEKNKQKPKTIIDFLIKECNLSAKEAISICVELYKVEKNRNNRQKNRNKQTSKIKK